MQVLDLPGIIEGAAKGKGRGREVIAVARSCDILLIVLDALKPATHLSMLMRELESFGIRLNREAPRISVNKTDKGGVIYSSMVESELDSDVCRAVLSSYKVVSANVVCREPGATVDDLIDVVESKMGGMKRIYLPAVIVCNKVDGITMEDLDVIAEIPHFVPISARDKWGLDDLMDTIWRRLELMRIYTKPPGQDPDFDGPVVLRKGSSVEKFCLSVHKSLVDEFKHAVVWGSSTKHNPQKVGLTHILHDSDVVQIVKR